jgi:serine protease AprX
MMRRLLWILVVAALVGLGATTTDDAGSGPPTSADRDGDRLFESLEAQLVGKPADAQVRVIVVLGAPASSERVRSLARRVGGFTVSRRFDLVHGFAATMRKEQLGRLASLTEVAHIEANATVHAAIDTAQTSFGVTQAKADAGVDGNADGNSDTYSKEDLVAAVVDSGIDVGHADLDDGKVIGWTDLVNDLPMPYDDLGHGTAVAAVVAGDGEGRPDKRYLGVAPGAALVGVKVLDDRGIGTIDDVVAGVEFAVAAKDVYGIEAVNLSLEQAGCSDGADAVSLAVNAAHDAGLVVVAAAGNRGPGTCTIGSPGAALKAVTVGAMSDLGEKGFALAPFSSRGRTLDGRIKPDIVGPGLAITTALAGTSSGYRALSGTSLATPFVTGLALLIRDANPPLGPQDVTNAIAATALDWARSGNNTAPGTIGPDVDYGAGRLSGYAAIESALGADIGSPPAMPVHGLLDGSLTGTGAEVDHPLNVIDPSFSIAATLIIPSITGASASSPDFDLYLLDPDGATVASATTSMRQDTLGYTPGAAGNYVLRVRSQSGSGDYFVDVSAGLPPPPPPPPQPPPQPPQPPPQPPQPPPQPSPPAAPSAPPPPAVRATPPSVAATTVKVVRGHRVVISVRVADCRPCEATLRMVVRGKRHIEKMPANEKNLVGALENVPSGRWDYAIDLEDTRRGLKSTTTRRLFVPRLQLRATARGSQVLVSLRGADCRRCQAAVKVRVHNVWRSAPLRRSGKALIATLGNLPGGRWPLYASIRYPDGIEVTSEWRRVRVQ